MAKGSKAVLQISFSSIIGQTADVDFIQLDECRLGITATATETENQREYQKVVERELRSDTRDSRGTFVTFSGG